MPRYALPSQPTYCITQADLIEQCNLSITAPFEFPVGDSFVSPSAIHRALTLCTVKPSRFNLAIPKATLLELPQRPDSIPTGALQ